MADQVAQVGRLVAIDGSRGTDVTASAESLAAEVREHGRSCVISRWDASGLFGELAQAASNHRHLSARTLTLVYAADLAFRLKWEIRPALLAGHVVIAAPYVNTAVALALACGLRGQWLGEVMRFADKADFRGLCRERKADRGWKRRLDRGYAEYCAAIIESADASFKGKRTRTRTIDALQKMKGGKLLDLSKRVLESAARDVATGNPTASSSPTASRRRTSRK